MSLKDTMRWNPEQLLVTAAVLAGLWTVTARAQEPAALLRWKNGDVLPGKLLDSEPGQLRWSSPHFADDVVVDTGALESVLFPERAVPPTGTFRVATTSDDVWTADLIGSDDSTLVFSSKRYGRVRVNRDTVYALGRREHPDLIFDASQMKDWNLNRSGPIKHMTYKVYAYKGGWQQDLPDFSNLTPQAEGAFPAGWLDLGLAEAADSFGMVFEGRLETAQSGDYTFEVSSDDLARLSVDGKPVAETKPGRSAKESIKLAKGSHSLRVEFVEFGGTEWLSVKWTGPGFAQSPLVGTNPASGWRRGLGGHPQTDRTKAGIFHALELPSRFELDLELSSTERPRFVLALSEDLERALRLETWADEVVVLQDKLFEPVLTIEKEQRNVRLRLAFDGVAGVLKVFDSTGRSLVNLEGVRRVTEGSGLFVKSRGGDLTVRRLSLYRQPATRVEQKVDTLRPRVHMIDGEVIPGRLFVDEDRAYVLDGDQSRRDVDLGQVDRIAQPDIQLAASAGTAELTYADGAVLRGRIEQLGPDHAILRTAFADEPVVCALAEASVLRLSPPGSRETSPDRDDDELFCAAGRLRGRLTFGAAGSPLRWQPEGAEEPVRLTDTGKARVERSGERVSKEPLFDAEEFPHVLHLKNGEVIPGRVSLFDASTVGFQSPFIRGREMDPAHVKAVDFSGETLAAAGDEPDDKRKRPAAAVRKWVDEKFGKRGDEPDDREKVKLERALTVPRFNRENPPSHILVARTGDLKRGNLLGVNGQTIQFESKLRKLTVPVDRVARVVDVSKPEEDPGKDPGKDPDEPVAVAPDPTGTVRATLADGSILVFEALESRDDGQLWGRSPIYGEMAIPVDGIQHLQFGQYDAEKFKSAFEDWVVRPAREPEYADR